MVAKVVYRVVTALIAACVIPLAIFSPLVRIVGDMTITDSYVAEDVSAYDIYDLFFDKDSTFEGFGELKLTEKVKEVLPNLIAAGCCLAAALLLSLVIIGFAAFSNRRLVILCLSAGAIVSMIAMFVTFGNFAEPFMTGKITIADLGLMESEILKTVVSTFITIKLLQISSAGFLIIIAFSGILLWTLSFMLTEIGDPKKVKKLR